MSYLPSLARRAHKIPVTGAGARLAGVEGPHPGDPDCTGPNRGWWQLEGRASCLGHDFVAWLAGLAVLWRR